MKNNVGYSLSPYCWQFSRCLSQVQLPGRKCSTVIAENFWYVQQWRRAKQLVKRIFAKNLVQLLSFLYLILLVTTPFWRYALFDTDTIILIFEKQNEVMPLPALIRQSSILHSWGFVHLDTNTMIDTRETEWGNAVAIFNRPFLRIRSPCY